MQDIDTQGTDEIVCPYCGYVLADSWELGERGEVDCPECSKRFDFTSEVEVSYYSVRDCELNGEEHVYGLVRHQHIVTNRCKNCDRWRFVPDATHDG